MSGQALDFYFNLLIETLCLKDQVSEFETRGGGGRYLSTVRATGTCHFYGYFFHIITELWVSFSQFFEISRNYGCPFQGIFHNFPNYAPDTNSICEIMALKSTRIYGIMGTDSLGKMARPRHIIG